MPPPRGTKLRTFITSGPPEAPAPSHARLHKPPARVISERKAAALSSGGGKLPPKLRKELDREPIAKRVVPEPKQLSRTRYGKREPRGARHDEAAEMRDARPSRRAGNRPPDPGTRRDREPRKIAREHLAG